ncbi:MAG: HU family DNA-binding protein [Chloroflexi bacterium]|nr:HU family DNA-binding protein [Chloroflexota bacterium]
MSLNKKSMVREIGRRTRLTNRDVQAVIETLIDVWTDELVSGGRIEIENFMVITTHPANKRVLVRMSKRLLSLCKTELGKRY